MTTPLNLPDDLLIIIIELVDDIHDLTALSAQCRKLHQIIDIPNRYLYHRIRLNSPTTVTQAYRLLIEILRKPLLGSYVRQLELNRNINDRPHLNPGEVDPDTDRLAWRALTALGFPVEEQRRFPGNVLGALFLIKCPNIRCLRIGVFPVDPILKVLAENNAKRYRFGCLENLEEVQILADEDDADGRFYNSTEFMLMMKLFHRLPSIQVARVGCTFMGKSDLRKLVPKKSNISQIIIEHSDMDTADLVQILGHPQALYVFEYGVGGRAKSGRTSRIIPIKIGRALQQHRSTLQILSFDVDEEISWLLPSRDDPMEVQSDYFDENDDHIEYEDSDLEESSDSDSDPENEESHPSNDQIQEETIPPRKYGLTIGSLHDFSELTHFSIGINLLAGPGTPITPPPPRRLIDSLPPSLEFLCIFGYREGQNEYHTSVVSELMEKKAERFPRLKEVYGVLDHFPNSKSVEDPDNYPGLLADEPDFDDTS